MYLIERKRSGLGKDERGKRASNRSPREFVKIDDRKIYWNIVEASNNSLSLSLSLILLDRFNKFDRTLS